MLPGLDEEWDRKEVWERSWKIWYTFLLVFVSWNRGDNQILGGFFAHDF